MTRKASAAASAATPFAPADAVPSGPAPSVETASLPQAERAPLGDLVAGAPDRSLGPARPPEEAEPLDAHGHDLSRYDWIPVLRKRRPDGWSPEKQRKFIEELADSGSVTASAYAVGMSPSSAYRLRRSPGGEQFAAAWEAAIAEASKRLTDIAFERATKGVEQFVIDKEGRHIYTHIRYNDRLLMFLLRAHQPDRYRHADARARHPNEAPPPVALPMAEAIGRLEPAMPPDPHLLIPPDTLESRLLVADICEGDLPHWHRDPPVDEPWVPTAADKEIDRILDQVRAENAAREGKG